MFLHFAADVIRCMKLMVQQKTTVHVSQVPVTFVETFGCVMIAKLCV